jgi:hypothetical protein
MRPESARRARGSICIVPGDAARIARNWASSEIVAIPRPTNYVIR